MVSLETLSVEGFEHVVRMKDPSVGLDGFIAVHSTELGVIEDYPHGRALGGLRVWSYDSTGAALEDATRLAKGMSEKWALADLPMGGAKAVVNATQEQKTPKLLEAVGCAIAELVQQDIHYITAEDVGTNVRDMEHVRTTAGRSHVTGFVDPSMYTAYGVFSAMNATCIERDQNIQNMHVALQGVGKVGMPLARVLYGCGARVTVCDTNPEAIKEATNRGFTVVDPDDIYDVPCDIFAPCALGQTVNGDTLTRFYARIICGPANNQLVDATVAQELYERDILYVPDVVVNAGGIVSVFEELMERHDPFSVLIRVDEIGARTQHLLSEAHQQRTYPLAIAQQYADKALKSDPVPVG